MADGILVVANNVSFNCINQMITSSSTTNSSKCVKHRKLRIIVTAIMTDFRISQSEAPNSSTIHCLYHNYGAASMNGESCPVIGYPLVELKYPGPRLTGYSDSQD